MMNWIQHNKPLAGILGVMIAGAIGLGICFYLSYDEYSTVRDQWTAQANNVASLQSSKVYPNAQNVKVMGERILDYRNKFAALRKVLLAPNLQQPVKPVSETEFQAKVKDRAIAVKKNADLKGMKLPGNDFALGFEGYATELPPNAALAAELNVHLDVIEKLITTLIDSGVSSLDSITRTKLTGEKNTGKNDAPAPAPLGNIQPTPLAEPVLDRYTITCVFVSDQGPLQNVMNALSNFAKMPHFLAVRLMRVENEKLEGASKDEIKNLIKSVPPASADAPKREGEAAPATNAPTPLPPDAVAIMGAEELKVYLEIDYVRFRKSE